MTERQMTEAAARTMGLNWNGNLGETAYESCSGLMTDSGAYQRDSSQGIEAFAAVAADQIQARLAPNADW